MTALIAEFAAMGWFGLVLPEAAGGSGLSAVEHALFYREVGRQCGPIDVLAQALAAMVAEAPLRDALLAGEVVPPARLAEMQDDVPYLSGGYGLGLVRVPLSCGDAWGHSGFVPGYQTIGLALPDGPHAFLSLNTSLAVNLIPPPTPATAYELFELALC